MAFSNGDVLLVDLCKEVIREGGLSQIYGQVRVCSEI